MPWDNVECHPTVRKTVVRSISRGLFGQTCLIYGPPGAGQASVAQAIAQTIVCKEIAGDFCGVCRECRLIQSGEYTDVFNLFPWEDWDKPKRKGKFYSVDHMRMMQQHATIMPYEGERKIFVIHHADLMEGSAPNSLLKILEEPYEHNIFLLLTDSVSRILTTILSRCWKVRLVPMGIGALVERLKADMPEDAAETIARAAGGLPELAGTLIGEDYLDKRDQTIELLKKLRASETYVGEVATIFAKKKEGLQEALAIVSGIMRDGVLSVSGVENGVCLNPDRREEIARLWQGSQPGKLIEGIEKIVDALDAITGSANPNHNILFNDLFLSLHLAGK